jgi:hypothetical protein
MGDRHAVTRDAVVLPTGLPSDLLAAVPMCARPSASLPRRRATDLIPIYKALGDGWQR